MDTRDRDARQLLRARTRRARRRRRGGRRISIPIPVLMWWSVRRLRVQAERKAQFPGLHGGRGRLLELVARVRFRPRRADRPGDFLGRLRGLVKRTSGRSSLPSTRSRSAERHDLERASLRRIRPIARLPFALARSGAVSKTRLEGGRKGPEPPGEGLVVDVAACQTRRGARRRRRRRVRRRGRRRASSRHEASARA